MTTGRTNAPDYDTCPICKKGSGSARFLNRAVVQRCHSSFCYLHARRSSASSPRFSDLQQTKLQRSASSSSCSLPSRDLILVRMAPATATAMITVVGSQFASSGLLRRRSPLLVRHKEEPLRSVSGFGACAWRGSGRRFSRFDVVVAKAEDQARSSSSTSAAEKLVELNSSKQLQELTYSSGECDPICSVDDSSSQEFEANFQPKTDLLKAVAIFAAAVAGTIAINHSWVAENQDLAMALLFGIGYAGIIFEESLAFNKSGVGLLMAVSLWVVRSIGAPSTDVAVSELQYASAEVSEIVFFLLGAMTIVEIVDAHQGFKLVTDNITTRKPRSLLWVVGFVTFFLSSVLDNLTSTIVMVSLLRKLVPPSEYRKLLGAVVVIAANAGGAWTPIGDVTTTMLWIHGQISTLPTMLGLVVPSVVSLAVPLALLSFSSDVNGKGRDASDVFASEQMAPRGQLVFAVGIGALIFVPIFKAATGLPPYMGMLLGLGVLWILTDAIHYGEDERQKLKVPQALSRIDTQGALFFLGILLSVSSLEAAGILRELANYLDAHIPNIELIASAIGIVSAIIDNVPLVAATMGMYDLNAFPQDSEFWQLVAYCAGTGGSMLIIGSAAGVAFMGMEKVDFFWYFKKVSGVALAGYAAGIAVYLGVHNLQLALPSTLAQVPFLPGS